MMSDARLISRRAALLGLAAGSAILSAPELARAEDEWGKIVAAAKKEGHVVLYSAFVGLAAHQDLKKDFQAALRHHRRYPGGAGERDARTHPHRAGGGPLRADVSENGGRRPPCRSRRITSSIRTDRFPALAI